MCALLDRLGAIVLTAGVVGPLLTVPGGAGAQETCDFIDPGNDLLVQRAPFTYVTNPHLLCEGDVEIWADSAVVNSDQQMTLLLGGVRYADPSRELRAGESRYFYEIGRLQGQGNVFVTNYGDGSTVENGDLVYLRQTDTRTIEEMTFTTGSDGLRPRATVYPRRAEPDSAVTAEAPDAVVVVPDTATAPAEPDEYIVVGDRVFFRGDSYFTATGTVEIERDSLFAFGDSAEYTGEEGTLILEGSARVEGSTYELAGRTIALASAADGTDEVRALPDALLTGEDLRVTSPQIILELAGGELQRMVAVPLPEETARPRAVSGDIDLTGDSLDLAAPGGVLERIFAAGRARSVSSGRGELNVESLPELARTDWIEAVTIEVLLLPVGPDSASADSTSSGDYEVDRIIARLNARSLYRLVPNDSTAVLGVDPPALHYEVADTIRIHMVDGGVDRVESIGGVEGWHLEPLLRAPADSLSAPDSLATPVPADTLAAPLPPMAWGPIEHRGGDVAPPGAYLFPMPSTRRQRLP